jgi:hypothetical protein
MTEEKKTVTLAEKAQQLILERQQLAIRLNEINGALTILDEIVLSQNASQDEVPQEETPEEIETEV